MKLDTSALRYLAAEDWRVLTAVEQGSKNHEIVPTPLIVKLSGLKGGSGAHKSISTLAKFNLIARTKNASYDGYRLTYGGLDYLALHTHQKRNSIYSVGNQIGVGKESDVYVVAPPPTSKSHSSPPSRKPQEQIQEVLKIHRLGRVSFRTVKTNRDYLRNRSSGSWMYMSRLAATKEFAFMEALYKHGFCVPIPRGQNRHTVLMELVDAFPLRQIVDVPDPAGLYEELIEMILQLAQYGLIHGDFNEFNILIKEEDAEEKASVENEQEIDLATSNTDQRSIKLTPVLIDFPQTLSMSHTNAEMYFDRDVACIKRFFQRRFGFVSSVAGPSFAEAKARIGLEGAPRLDVEVEASGFSRKMAKELEGYMEAVGVDGDHRDIDGLQVNSDSENGEDGEETLISNVTTDVSTAGRTMDSDRLQPPPSLDSQSIAP
ncbi:MAG: hypothetical protein M1814_002849 [Vezdaea aestivalis]|nr:MAG: hypothetical protein M1814_002849 [Vezdaea aestivalis]